MKEYLIEEDLLNKYIKLTIFPNAFYVIESDYSIKTIQIIHHF